MLCSFYVVIHCTVGPTDKPFREVLDSMMLSSFMLLQLIIQLLYLEYPLRKGKKVSSILNLFRLEKVSKKSKVIEIKLIIS